MAIGAPHFIGKESNKLEEVDEGGVPDAGDVYTEYPDPRHNQFTWNETIVKLRALTKSQLKELAEQSGISITTLKAWKRGRPPHPSNRQKLTEAIR